jgi:sugar O-acyltransferase (sialic acid O-acetyltransferase NeuD family)
VEKKRKLVIVGSGEFGRIAFEYFTYDSEYKVVAFSVERDFLEESEIEGRPVVPFEELAQRFDPKDHDVYVAVTYTQLNRVRTRLFKTVKTLGYQCATYVSSRAFVWRNVELGENVFIFENNVVQPFCKIEDNVVLWSGNHIGHRSVVEENCYLSSHVVVSGYCRIGNSSFVGVNATFADNVTIGPDCLIGMASTVNRDLEGGKIWTGSPVEASRIPSLRYFKVKEVHL